MVNHIDKRIGCVVINFEPARIEKEIMVYAYQTLIPSESRNDKQDYIGNKAAIKEGKKAKNDK